MAIKELVHDEAVLSTPCEKATAEDAQVAQDLLDTMASLDEAACLHANQIGVTHNLFAGRVKEIGYFGSYNNYIVVTPQGTKVKITEPNGSRHELLDITWEDDVFFWWDDADPVVLTQ